MASRICTGEEQVILLRRQTLSFPVEELPSPACGSLAFSTQGLQVHTVLLCFSLQMWQEVLMAREVVMLEVVGEAQTRVQRMKLETPLLQAKPLPSSMDPFRIQHMVWCQ